MWKWCLPLDALVRARWVVILMNVFGEQLLEMAFIEWDSMIEKLSADISERPFRYTVLLWTMVGRAF